MAVYFLVTAWSNLFLALLVIPLAWFVWKEKKAAIILSKVYVALLTVVLIAGYIEAHRDASGNFASDLTPVYFYLILGAVTLRYLYLEYKAEKQKIA